MGNYKLMLELEGWCTKIPYYWSEEYRKDQAMSIIKEANAEELASVGLGIGIDDSVKIDCMSSGELCTLLYLGLKDAAASARNEGETDLIRVKSNEEIALIANYRIKQMFTDKSDKPSGCDSGNIDKLRTENEELKQNTEFMDNIGWDRAER